MNHWLMKSEPSEFGIDDLKSRPGQTEHWDGVRNYQARNMMRDQMQVGDQAFFYHSNCEVPGIVGVIRVCSEPYPDFTAFDSRDKHYDPKSDQANPRWFMVDVQYVKKFKRTIPLAELKACSALQDMPLVRKGNRLSIMPVTKEQWSLICGMQ